MRRCLALLLLAATAAVAAPTPPADRDAAFERIQRDARASRLLDLAADDIKNKRLDAALAHALEAEKLRPNDAAVLNTKGAALTELRRFDDARVALEAALVADPNGFAPQYNLGEILALQKRYSDAAVHFTVLESRFGALPLLKYKIYLCHALGGNTERAAERLRQMRYPEDGAAWYFAQAVALAQAGKKREARELVAAAAAIHPKEVDTYRDTLRDSELLD